MIAPIDALVAEALEHAEKVTPEEAPEDVAFYQVGFVDAALTYLAERCAKTEAALAELQHRMDGLCK